jgi:hypothetical protein
MATRRKKKRTGKRKKRRGTKRKKRRTTARRKTGRRKRRASGGHAKLRSTCKKCGKAHSAHAHASHGPGSFARTHGKTTTKLSRSIASALFR